MTSTIIAPITETTRLYRLNPVTLLSPSAVKISPPTTAPTIPRTILRKKPAPFLLTILAAMKPAISPSTIQTIMDTADPLSAGSTSLTRGQLWFQGAGNGAGLTRSTLSSSVQGHPTICAAPATPKISRGSSVRVGTIGAAQTGVPHGLFCLGCC